MSIWTHNAEGDKASSRQHSTNSIRDCHSKAHAHAHAHTHIHTHTHLSQAANCVENRRMQVRRSCRDKRVHLRVEHHLACLNNTQPRHRNQVRLKEFTLPVCSCCPLWLPLAVLKGKKHAHTHTHAHTRTYARTLGSLHASFVLHSSGSRTKKLTRAKSKLAKGSAWSTIRASRATDCVYFGWL